MARTRVDDVSVEYEVLYVKAKDEITSTNLTVKAQKDRYAGAVWQVAVRTLHEVFEADRAGKIQSIALTVGTDIIAAATGRPETVPLVAVAADRATFSEFDLRPLTWTPPSQCWTGRARLYAPLHQ